MKELYTDSFQDYFSGFQKVIQELNATVLSDLIQCIINVKNKNGRIFFLGMGGSAANCQHAVNDFRKLCGIEAYSATDNVAEFSARVNDEGLSGTFREYLRVANIDQDDCVFVLSVGGGDRVQNVSANICEAIDFAKSQNAKILGIVGRKGYTSEKADACIVMNSSEHAKYLTPFAESLQHLVWHFLVSHPLLKVNSTKW